MEQRERDQARDERAGHAHGDGLRDAHRVAAGQRQPRERADEQAADGEEDQVDDEAHRRLADVAVGGVRVAAAGLGEAAAEQVAERDDADVEPDLPGGQAVIGVVAGLGHGAGDEQTDDDGDVRPELRRLERLLGLRAEKTWAGLGGGAGSYVGASDVRSHEGSPWEWMSGGPPPTPQGGDGG